MYQITYHQAREIIMAMLRIALKDLHSNSPLRRKEARDWLIGAGLSLAEEVHAGISLTKMVSYIHEADHVNSIDAKERFRGNSHGKNIDESGVCG